MSNRVIVVQKGIAAGIAALAVLAAGFWFAGCSEAPSKPRPNVILVVVDALRADHLGSYGFDGDVSPNIDALADESVLFERCIAGSPWTSPSVATMFTSLHLQNHCAGLGNNQFCEEAADSDEWSTLSGEAITMAEIYRLAGYETVGFVGNYILKSKFGFAQGFDLFIEPEGVKRHVAEDELMFQAARRWLHERRSEKPFFLYLHLMDVHAPYRVNPDDLAAIRGSTSLGSDRPLTAEEVEARPGHLGALIRWPDEETSARLLPWREAYAAGVRRLDRRLGLFFEHLNEQGLFENSILVFTSDHGEEFLEHGAWEHGRTLYETALHVPLLIRLPGLEDGARRFASTVSLVDLLPTLLGACGIVLDRLPMQGRNLVPLLSDPASQEPRWAFATGIPERPSRVAAQDDRLKLILDLEDGSSALYDLAADPRELRDLSASQPDLLRAARGKIDEHLEVLRDYPSYRPVRTTLDEQDRERLRSLGYVQ